MDAKKVGFVLTDNAIACIEEALESLELTKRDFKQTLKDNHKISERVWRGAIGEKTSDIRRPNFFRLTNLCRAINQIFKWKETYAFYIGDKLPTQLATELPSPRCETTWQWFCDEVAALPKESRKRYENPFDLVKLGAAVWGSDDDSLVTRRLVSKLPRGVESWTRSDQAPNTLELGSVAANVRPLKRLLVSGQYAWRPRVYSDLNQSLDSWLTSYAEISNEEQIPLFWIGGPSGSGKSVALLFALSHLAEERQNVVVSVRNARKLPELFEWWADQSVSNAKLYIGVDDPYSPQYSRREEIWQDLLGAADDIAIELGPSSLPILLACGPTEQYIQLQKTMASQSRALAPAPDFLVPMSVRKEAAELTEWYTARTGLQPKNIDFDEDMPIVQLFWELQHGKLTEFSDNLRTRLIGFDEKQRTSFIDFVTKTLAFNRLYIGLPAVLLESLTAVERDFLDILSKELAYDGGNIGDTRSSKWLMHPHLAGLVYNAWIQDGYSGDDVRISHLLTSIETAHNISKDKHATAAALLSLARAMQGVSSDNPLFRDFPWVKAWEQLLELYSGWSDALRTDSADDIVPPHPLLESIPAWIEIRTYQKPPNTTENWKLPYDKRDPFKLALSAIKDLRSDDPMREELLESIAYRAFAIGKRMRGKVIAAVHRCLLSDETLSNWSRIAHGIIRNTGHKATQDLAVAWLKRRTYHDRGWTDLWRIVAKSSSFERLMPRPAEDALQFIESSGVNPTTIPIATILARKLVDWAKVNNSSLAQSYLARVERLTFSWCSSTASTNKNWPLFWTNAVRCCRTPHQLEYLAEHGNRWLKENPNHGQRNRILKKLIEITPRGSAGELVAKEAIIVLSDIQASNLPFLLYSIWIRSNQGDLERSLLEGVASHIAKISNSDFQKLISAMCKPTESHEYDKAIEWINAMRTKRTMPER